MNKLEQQLYSLAETAELLGISRKTLYNYRRDNKIKTVQMGRQVKVHKDEIQRITKEGISLDK